MDDEMIKRVSKAILKTPNASDYDTLVAINAIKAMLKSTPKMREAARKYHKEVDDAGAYPSFDYTYTTMIGSIVDAE